MDLTGPSILEKEHSVASLEDTFRMMKGDEPINENKLNEGDKLKREILHKQNNQKTTRNFLEACKNTLVEFRTGTVNESPADPKEVKAYRDGLVDAGKKIVAGLSAIKFDHPDKSHDINALNQIENDMKQLMAHLQMFPELRSYVKGNIKLPSRPKRQKRGF
jgi:hypothetical protein